MAVGDGGRSRSDRSTVVLEETDEGRWRATQSGVGVTGYGDTAAEAAAEYCRLVSR